MKSKLTMALLMAALLFAIQPLLGCSEPESVSATVISGNAVPVNPQSQDAAAKTKAATETKAASETVEGEWGHFSGTVTVDGVIEAPEEEAVGDHVDKAVCLVDGKVPADDNIVVNTENNGLRDVYVIMYLKEKKDPAIHPSYETKKAEPVVLDNVNCRFVPHATFVRTGQKLILKNSDAVGHNCHITTFNNEHNPTLPANQSTEITFDTEDSRPGNVTCDLHKWMDSVIFIRDNPYVAITDADGKFTIENLPAGEWEFQFWHKKVGYMKDLAIDNHEVSKRGVTGATIKAGETTDLGGMKLPTDSFK